MYVLIILMLIGFLAMDMVYVAVAVNYCAQCELLIFLIRGLNERIEEKSIPLQQAIRVPKHEFHLLRHCYSGDLADWILVLWIGLSQCWELHRRSW